VQILFLSLANLHGGKTAARMIATKFYLRGEPGKQLSKRRMKF